MDMKLRIMHACQLILREGKVNNNTDKAIMLKPREILCNIMYE